MPSPTAAQAVSLPQWARWRGEMGAEVDLARVHLKYPGLAPWEIWLSEAQERMVLAMPEESEAQLQALCEAFDVELTDLGAFTDTGRLIVRYDEQLVLDLASDFLYGGCLVDRSPLDCQRPP